VEIAERTANATVKKAEGDATSIKLQVQAESETIKMRAGANAEAIRLKAIADSEATKLIANADAEKIAVTGNAEAGKILAIGKSTAEAYQLAVAAMGGDNFTKYKVTEEIGKGRIKIIPDVLINGNGGDANPMSGLLGLKLMEMIDASKKEETTEAKKENPNTNDLKKP